jgi:hypothetical protein
LENSVQTINGNQPQAMIDPRTMADRINKIHQLVKTVMKENVHYGRLPGCGDKPTLLLPGAQVLKVAFKIATRYIVEDLSVTGEKTFRVTAEVYDQTTGSILGYGMGECSSSEEKYAWRNAVCDEEFDATEYDMKREKYCKGRDGFYTKKQIRTNPADIANTVLKMATKRADVHGTINVTSASEVFTQDVEDLPEGYEFEDTKKSTKPNVTENDVSFSDGNSENPTEEQMASLKLISTKQAGLLRGECKKQKIKPETIATYCKVKNVNWLTWQKSDQKCFEKILKTVQEKPDFFIKLEADYQKAKESAQNNAPAAPEAPAVMGVDDFVALAISTAKSVGLEQDKAELQMDMEFSFKSFADVPADKQNMVIDWLNTLGNTAGA